MPQPESLVTSPERAGWLVTFTDQFTRQKPHARVLSGSIILLLSAALVSAINFGYTVSMARMLGPAAFGHVSAAMTILMLVSAITLAFQLVCAKFVARNERPGARVKVYHSLLGKAWIISLCVGAGLFLTRSTMAKYLNLPDPWILGVLAIGISAYVPLGVRRGAMQGVCSFGRLSGNSIIESVAKFVTAILLVSVGYGVLGAVGAISASVLVAYLVPSLPEEFKAASERAAPTSFREGAQAIVFFVGQVIINNIDILLVKHFFAPEQAGLYAAVALVGRVLYFAAWSVVSAMFPVSAAAKPREEDPNVILVPLLFVLGIGVTFVLVLSFFPALVVQTIFGNGFSHAEPLLAQYAVATGLYALSVVLMAYEMSRRIANTGWLQLAFSGILVLAIGAFHATLQDVIMVQIVLMAMMLLFVSFPFFRRYKLLLGKEAT